MAPVVPALSGREQRVTASQLVRHFGVWQERAARAPVYILHRGRPRFVLTSIEVMDALCAPHTPAARRDDLALAALLDARDEIALIVDDRGDIALASRAAASRFGDAVRTGARPGMLSLGGGELLSDAIGRVLASGIAETVEIIPARFETRRLVCQITPFPEGCLIRAHDIAIETMLVEERAQGSARRAAGEMAGSVSIRIGLRGYLTDPPAALSAITGIARATLATVRFVGLFTVASRVAIGEAIEALIDGGAPHRMNGDLLIRGDGAIPVTIGMAATREAGRTTEIAAAITIPLPASAPAT